MGQLSRQIVEEPESSPQPGMSGVSLARAVAGTVLEGRYALVDLLGETGHSAVYEAEDTEGHRRVCVKILKEEALRGDPEAALRFRREAQTLAQLSHPHIVRVHALGEHGAELFLVMDLLRGATLETSAREGMQVSQVLRVLTQLVDGLAHVHRRGIVHSDLKPANVFVLGEGDELEVRIIDFGFAAFTQGAEGGAPVGGTLAYLAPEQAGLLRAAVGPRSDLYALGCIAYELLTTQPAFDGEDETSVLQKVRGEMPTPLRARVPDVPVALERIVTKLLAKAPDDRYQTAEGLLRDLRRVEDDLRAGRATSVFDLDLGSKSALALTGNIFVGREAELARADWMLGQVAAGKPHLLLVGGRSGAGKSAFIGEVVGRGLTRNVRQAAGKCYALQTGFPYFGLSEALTDAHRLFAQLPKELQGRLAADIRKTARRGAAELLRMSPRWRDVFPDHEEATYEGEEKARERLGATVVAILRAIVRPDSPLVFFIDDLQWADSGTIDLLRALLDKLDGCGVLLIGTYRSDEVDAGHPLERLRKPASAGELPATCFELGPLSVGETGTLAARLFRRAPPETFVQALHQRSGGNAFFMWELLRAFAGADVLRATDEGLEVDLAKLETVQLPTDMLEVVRRRLGALPELGRRALGVAAILGRSFSFSLLEACLEAPDEELFAALRAAQDAQLIVETGKGVYEFGHDKLLEACVAFVPDVERAPLHRRIGEYLERQKAQGQGTGELAAEAEQIFDLALHFGRSDDEVKGLEYCRRAADRAKELLQNEQALALYRRCDEIVAGRGVAPDAPERMELALLVGEVHDTMGVYPEAQAIYEKALGIETRPFEKARILTRLSQTLLKRGEIEDSRQNLVASLELVGWHVRVQSPNLAFWAFLARLEYLVSVVVTRLSPRGRTEPGPRAALINECLTRLWLIHSIHDVGRHNRKMYYFAYRNLAMAQRVGECRELSVAHRMMAITLCQGPRPNFVSSVRHIFRCVEVARRVQAKMEIAVGLLYVGIVHTWSNQPATAVGYLKTAQESLEQLGDVWELVNTHIFQFMCYRVLAKLDDALVHALEIVKIAERANAAGSLASGSAKVGELLLYKGEQAQGEDYIRRASTLAEEKKLRFDGYQAAKVRGLLALRAGRWEQAREAYQKAIELNEKNNFMRAYIFDAYVGWAESVVRNRVLCESDEGAELVRRAGEYLATAVRMEQRYRNHLVYAYRVRALYELKVKNDRAAAAADLQRAWDLVEAEERRFERPFVLEARAELALESDRAEAEKLYRKAAELFTEMGAQGEERRVEAAMARHGWLVETAETSTVEAAQLRALLDVALATTSSLDAASQSRAALDELVRVFGAERAFLFLLNEDSNALVMTAGRDAQGHDLNAQTDYSNTVVEKVRATRAPVVVTGTAQGALLGSESALVYNLRSIFAAPLMVKDKLVGVVYLDNRLEKGLRTKTDLQVLQAIAGHIAIAIESARAARVELDRRALENENALLEKDLELTSAVQAMFLPRTAEIDRGRVKAVGFCRPARQCGGDWWWIEPREDGTTLVLVGDVTGHGAPSAMVTASFATAYRASRRANPKKLVRELLQELNLELLEVCQGKYCMTMSALELDPEGGLVRWHNCGAPSIFLMEPDGKVQVVSAIGSPLGTEPFSVGSVEKRVAAGTRLFVFTDGLPELELPNDRVLGVRRLSQAFADSRTRPLKEASRYVVGELDKARKDIPQGDDVTFVLCDLG
jgi:serine phosphatase RsbU (regulator of sigma subunit)/tetratricopeptide (TPR) repeat protein